LFISLSTLFGNFWIHRRKIHTCSFLRVHLDVCYWLSLPRFQSLLLIISSSRAMWLVRSWT